MKNLILIVAALLLAAEGFSQRTIRISGVSTFEDIEKIDWSNTTGEMTISRDSINFCASAYEHKCMGIRLFGEIKQESFKYKGQQFTQRIQSAETSEGDTITVRKVLAKKYEKFYDILWLDYEGQPDLGLECENLIRRKEK